MPQESLCYDNFKTLVSKTAEEVQSDIISIAEEKGIKEDIGQIDGLKLIDLENGSEEDKKSFEQLADTVGLFEAIDFIKKAKDICRKATLKAILENNELTKEMKLMF